MKATGFKSLPSNIDLGVKYIPFKFILRHYKAESLSGFNVLKGSYALSLASVVCAVSAYLAGLLPGPGLQIPIITLVTVFLATVGLYKLNPVNP